MRSVIKGKHQIIFQAVDAIKAKPFINTYEHHLHSPCCRVQLVLFCKIVPDPHTTRQELGGYYPDQRMDEHSCYHQDQAP